MGLKESVEPPERWPFVCPTCRAEQPRSPTCRRCRCDLQLIVSAIERYDFARRRCIAALAADHGVEALQMARECHRLDANAASTRRLAVALMQTGAAAEAVALAERRRG